VIFERCIYLQSIPLVVFTTGGILAFPLTAIWTDNIQIGVEKAVELEEKIKTVAIELAKVQVL
jgi:hypothetical protein